MIDDPYKVLGVPAGAPMDEVKKAYRRKAKQYHPDLHPNDPAAARKMNEVNEAYDMIMNPEKYRQRRAQEAQQQQARQAYGGYGGYGGQQSGGYEDFGGFEDIFRQFTGANYGGGIPRPQKRPGEAKAFAAAIDAINANRYAEALNILAAVPSTGRNARWYQLSALANYCAGNRVAAWEHIQKAAALAPDDAEIASAARVIGQDAQSYEDAGRGFTVNTGGTAGLCAGLCLAQLCCRMTLCRC